VAHNIRQVCQTCTADILSDSLRNHEIFIPALYVRFRADGRLDRATLASHFANPDALRGSYYTC
jgi:hypothetical protein